MEDVGALEQGLTSKIIFLVCCRYGYYVKRRRISRCLSDFPSNSNNIPHDEVGETWLFTAIKYFIFLHYFCKKKKKTGTLNVYIYFKMSRKEQYTKPFMKSL